MGGGGWIQGKQQVDIVWSHSSGASALQPQEHPTRIVWPVWLGIGPAQGVTVPLARVGVQHPETVVFRILEAAYAIVYAAEEPEITTEPHNRLLAD